MCFHSISFPSEWGLYYLSKEQAKLESVSIQLVSPASGDYLATARPDRIPLPSFHSISFPSEWGRGVGYQIPLTIVVSIQLVSPASGDLNRPTATSHQRRVSIQLVSPASGDEATEYAAKLRIPRVSIQLVSPASGDVETTQLERELSESVSIQLVSPASGDRVREDTSLLEE